MCPPNPNKPNAQYDDVTKLITGLENYQNANPDSVADFKTMTALHKLVDSSWFRNRNDCHLKSRIEKMRQEWTDQTMITREAQSYSTTNITSGKRAVEVNHDNVQSTFPHADLSIIKSDVNLRGISRTAPVKTYHLIAALRLLMQGVDSTTIYVQAVHMMQRDDQLVVAILYVLNMAVLANHNDVDKDRQPGRHHPRHLTSNTVDGSKFPSHQRVLKEYGFLCSCDPKSIMSRLHPTPYPLVVVASKECTPKTIKRHLDMSVIRRWTSGLPKPQVIQVYDADANAQISNALRERMQRGTPRLTHCELIITSREGADQFVEMSTMRTDSPEPHIGGRKSYQSEEDCPRFVQPVGRWILLGSWPDDTKLTTVESHVHAQAAGEFNNSVVTPVLHSPTQEVSDWLSRNFENSLNLLCVTAMVPCIDTEQLVDGH